MNRIAVRYKGKAMMPMKCSRAERYIIAGKGKKKYDLKLNIHYLQLKQEPSNNRYQKVVLSLDPGSCFDGISIISSDSHHANYELKQRAKKGDKSIKFLISRKSQYRRIRRSRLRHRKIRFDNRTGKKLTPTIRANLEFRIWLINSILRYYPITDISIEDVAFNHYSNSNGKSFSHVEIGKTKLYEFVKSLGVNLHLYKGHETKNLRISYFGYDPKIKDKGNESFEAHCIDSFVIGYDIIRSNKVIKLNKQVTFIEKIFRYRRYLFQLRPRKYKGFSNYYKLLKGGVKNYYQKLSTKRNICRVKPNGIHSNHPKEWIYIDNGFAIRKKMKYRRFGGKHTELSTFGNYINRKTFYLK